MYLRKLALRNRLYKGCLQLVQMLLVIGLPFCGFLEIQSTIIISLSLEGNMGVTALVYLMVGLMVLQMNSWLFPKFLNIHLVKTYLVWQNTHIGLLTYGVRIL